jgi:hypothetical protein
VASRRSVVAAALVVTATLVALPVGAEPSAQEKETARALMDQGDERFEQKNYKAALEAYRGAHAIMRVPTTAIEVAKAHEALGQLVEARDACLEAIRYPRATGEPAAFTEARADAERRASELGGRIPTVLVQIDPGPVASGLRVAVDQATLPEAAARLPIKVNPGRHRLLVSSETTEDAIRDLEVAEKENITVRFALSARSSNVALADASSPPARSAGPYRTAGLVTAGIGVVGLAVGTIFGLRASSQQDEASCPGNVCRDDASADKLRSANDAATISTLGFVVGGILLAGGTAMWLFAPDRAAARSARFGGPGGHF